MSFFHVIDDGQVVLRSKGVYRQAKVYRRGEDIYAAYGGGFIRLHGHNGTSAPSVSWLDIKADDVTVEANRAPVFSGGNAPKAKRAA